MKIPIENMEHGHLYRAHMRNGSIGVWNAETRGLIFIREKFGSRYLFTELHHDADSSYGTATPFEKLPDVVPQGVPVSEELTDCMHIYQVVLRGNDVASWRTQLEQHIALLAGYATRPIESRDTTPGQPGGYRLFVKDTDVQLPRDIHAAHLDNDPLFAWLEAMETKYQRAAGNETT